MSQYVVSGKRAKEVLKLVGVRLENDWKDGTLNVSVEEDPDEDFFIEWCERADVEAKLL